MKTLGIIALIWIVYSMYRVFIAENVYTNMWYWGINDFIQVSGVVGLLGIFVGIIYLIITYLP